MVHDMEQKIQNENKHDFSIWKITNFINWLNMLLDLNSNFSITLCQHLLTFIHLHVIYQLIHMKRREAIFSA